MIGQINHSFSQSYYFAPGPQRQRPRITQLTRNPFTIDFNFKLQRAPSSDRIAPTMK